MKLKQGLFDVIVLVGFIVLSVPISSSANTTLSTIIHKSAPVLGQQMMAEGGAYFVFLSHAPHGDVYADPQSGQLYEMYDNGVWGIIDSPV